MQIVHIGEFIDALRWLMRGHVLVVLPNGWAVMDGAPIYTAHRTLFHNGLLKELKLNDGFEELAYFTLSAAGLDFAKKAISEWDSMPMLKRLLARIF